MTNKDKMMALAEVRNRLYGTPFAGQQMMVVSDSIRIIDVIIKSINEDIQKEEDVNVCGRNDTP